MNNVETLSAHAAGVCDMHACYPAKDHKLFYTPA